MGLTDQGQQAPPPRVRAMTFANWREVLNQAQLAERTRAGYGLAIGGYLDYCLRNGLSVNKESLRALRSANAQNRAI